MNCISCGTKNVVCRNMCQRCYAKKRYYEKHDIILKQKHKYTNTHKEKINEYQKKYRKENKELINKKNKIYRNKNKVIILKRAKTYYQHNRTKILKYQKQFWKTPHGKILRKQKERNYRERLHFAISFFTTNEWIQKLEKTNGICPRCEKYVNIEKIELDHIYPISKIINFQIYTIDDVQPLCRSCNSIKNNKFEVKEEWQQYFL